MKSKTLILSLSILLISFNGLTAEKKINVLCTTFPVYQITRNVVKGMENINIQLMLPAQLGCPHDYALTPQNMRKLAKADVLVINGLGMEEFLGAPLKKANSQIKIIDSSAGLKGLIEFHDKNKHDDHHDHLNYNPHLFASPVMQGRMGLNIAKGLAEVDEAGAGTYQKNAKIYADKMEKLADGLALLGKQLNNNRIVQPHGIFDYLARDIGLKIIATLQSHGHEPSAAEMIMLVKEIKKEKAGAIFSEPQYPRKTAKTLSKETGIPFAMLDPVATGPENAPLDYFETVMHQNIKTLEKTLGVKK